MSGLIFLRCPKCGKTMHAMRDPSDHPRAAIVETQCPECVGGDFSSVAYFDADGEEINEDPENPEPPSEQAAEEPR